MSRADKRPNPGRAPSLPDLRRHIVKTLSAVSVTARDCGSAGHRIGELLSETGALIEPLTERVLGLVVPEDVAGPDGALLFATGRPVTRAALRRIGYHWTDHIRSVPVRSPRSCRSGDGICAVCAGSGGSATTRVGDAVGEEAARTILEGMAAMRKGDMGPVGRRLAAWRYEEQRPPATPREALSQIARTFAGTRPANPSVLAPKAGVLRYGKVSRGRVKVFIDGDAAVEIRHQPATFWFPREGQHLDAGEVLEWGDEEWLADVLKTAGEDAFHERFLARSQCWFRYFNARVPDRFLELWSRHMAARLRRGRAALPR